MIYRPLLVLIGLIGLGQVGHADPTKSATVAPIVDVASGQLYGAAVGNDWMTARDAEKFVKKNSVFHVYTNDGLFLKKTMLSRVKTSEICSNPTYRPKNTALPPRSTTLVGTTWNAAPRQPKLLDKESSLYREFVSIWLRDQGIDDPKPTLSQLWRIDLEGDGHEEVFIAASRHRGSETSTMSGDYSILLMRKLVGDEVNTIPLKSEIYPEACIAECALAVHEIIGTLDLNGDGALEIIVKSSDYESTTQAIYSVNDTHVEKKLEWVCGS